MDKKLFESKRALVTLASIGIVIVIKFVGNLLKLPEEATNEITEYALKVSIGYITAQTTTDVFSILKNKK